MEMAKKPTKKTGGAKDAKPKPKKTASTSAKSARNRPSTKKKKTVKSTSKPTRATKADKKKFDTKTGKGAKYDKEIGFDELHGPNVIKEALEAEGITPAYLAEKLKRELEATEVKTHFEKGMVVGDYGGASGGASGAATGDSKEGAGPDGTFTIRESGSFRYSEPLIAWKIRQVARMDAQKLLGLYPADKLELGINERALQFLKSIDGQSRGVLPMDEK